MDLYKEIKKSFPRIEKFFSEKTLSEFSKTLSGHLEKYNVGLGTMIRLKILRPKSVLYKKFAQEGFTCRDEMTMEIIKEFHKYVIEAGMSEQAGSL